MINQANASILQKHELLRKQQIASSYNSIEKGISPEQFEENYPKETFERYTAAAIKKFVDDYSADVEKSEDAEEANEIMTAELTGLKRITIEKGEKLVDMYVRPKSTEGEEDTSESDDEGEESGEEN